MNRLRQGWHILRYFGPRWVAYRAWLAAQQRLGRLERTLPLRSWNDEPLAGHLIAEADPDPEALLERLRRRRRFFFTWTDRPQFREWLSYWDCGSTGSAPSVQMAERIAAGDWCFFAHHWAHTGLPPDWHRNWQSGERVPSNLHWSRIDEFAHGDIKWVWEPSRFTPVYALVRAYWRTGDERWPELFWRLIEDWRAANPPQHGVNWKCGQEIALRIIAWTFGLFGFLEAEATTAMRAAQLVEMLAVSAERIERHLGYALSQRNNHGICEAVGLWTVGLVVPQLDRAAHWRALGRRHLESLAEELIYEDGSFTQHSVNYHRVMLDGYAWALRLGEVCEEPLADATRERIQEAVKWLFELVDLSSGRAPNYGSNDGSWLLPLSNGEYDDYRAVIQAGSWLTGGQRWLAPGPWDEHLFWLAGAEAIEGEPDPPERKDWSAPVGGYYLVRSDQGLAFTRFARLRDRPAQADFLHVDLWWRGVNLALDPGTFSYHQAAPWDNALGRTSVHNTVTVAGQDQMEQVSRFLWLPWMSGWVATARRSDLGDLALWEAEHDGYTRLVKGAVHGRALVQLGERGWLVLDRVAGPPPARLHWLLCDAPHEFNAAQGRLGLELEAGPVWVQTGTTGVAGAKAETTLVRADPASTRGWWSPRYGLKLPALSLALEVQAQEAGFWTLFTWEPMQVSMADDVMCVRGADWEAQVRLAWADRPGPLVRAVTLRDAREDTLTVAA